MKHANGYSPIIADRQRGRFPAALWSLAAVLSLHCAPFARAQNDALEELGLAVAPEEDVVEATPNATPEGDPRGGLTAHEVVVVANVNVPGSVELARHYIQLRGIPRSQLLVTGMPDAESVSRNDYEQMIAGPLRQFLTDEKLDHARCVALMYGVPLKVVQPSPSADVREMVQMVRSHRQYHLEQVLDALIEVGKLGRPEGAEAATTATVAFDPSKPARDQIRAMRDTAFAAFEQAAEALEGTASPEARAAGEERWRALWNRTFGVLPPPADMLEQPAETAEERQERLALLMRARALLAGEMTVDALREMFEQLAPARGAVGVIEISGSLERRVRPDTTWRAAVDSELATLFWPPFPLDRYVANPLHMDEHGDAPGRTLMVCRLDGPSEEVVRRMIDLSVAVERNGLVGRAYVDARGRTGGSPYAVYDQDLTRLAGLLKTHTTIPTVLDEREQLFQPGECPDAALYVGWYSLARYVDAFSFVPGAVGYHIASSEAVSLRRANNSQWCAQLLNHGVVATLGPVEEPYLTAFPRATEFFGLLLTGKYTLVECYYLTTPYVSWMMTLIGDPLYNPFGARPALSGLEKLDEAPD